MNNLMAVIDIGSLKVKLTVFDNQALDVICQKSYLTFLGKNISEDGNFNKEDLDKLDKAIFLIKEELSNLDCSDIKFIATESLRVAKNTADVYQIIEKYFPSHNTIILNQDIEGEMFFKAVSQCFKGEIIVAMDVGGGSVQIFNGAFEDEHLVYNKYLYKTGTYILHQKYSPDMSIIEQEINKVSDVVKKEYDSLDINNDVLIFGSSCMYDFLNASGIKLYNDRPIKKHPVYTKIEDLKELLSRVVQFAPDNREHFYPEGNGFCRGADYLLINVIEVAERLGAKYIYPTNINSSYGFID